MGCDNRCNSSLACGLTNTIIKKLIAENCGEGGIEEPDTSGCEATFVTATSFNGAPLVVKSCSKLSLGNKDMSP